MYKSIEYKGLHFTYTKKEDLPLIAAMLAKESVCKQVYFDPYTMEDTEDEYMPLIEEIAYYLTERETPPSHLFTITEDNEFVGLCGLLELELSKDNYLVGYTLDDTHWKQGKGTKTVEFLLDFSFEEIGANKLTSESFKSNKHSQKILEKLGFKKEGLIRDEYFCKGTYHDNVVYGILSHEYKRI